MSSSPHRLKIKCGDFELELEGDREYVENQSKDIPTILSMLPTIQPIRKSTEATTLLPVARGATILEDAKSVSIGEFLALKKFSSDVDIVLGVGYYLENYLNMEAYNSDDIKNQCRNGKCTPPKNISKGFTGNINKGFMMQAVEKKDGQLAYQVTNLGIEYVQNYESSVKKARKQKRAPTKSDDTDLKILDIPIDELNLNKYPDICKLERTEERGLLLLQIYSKEKKIDALSAEEIVAILKTKFAIPATYPQINTSLRRSKPKVDTIKIDGKQKYRLMKPGEAFLAELKQNNLG
jgi:hypothetical protein